MQGSGGAIFIIFGVAIIYIFIRYMYAVIANTGELDAVFDRIEQVNNKQYKKHQPRKERKPNMGRPKITDKYLFYEKEYKQKNRVFKGVKSSSALWRKVYFATEDYEETKDECMEHYGFYYAKKAHNKICENEWY